MRIAVTAETDAGLDSPVAQHFGHAPYFVLVDTKAGTVTSAEALVNPFAEGHAPGEIPGYIHQLGADVMLSGGMGGRAIQFFSDLGIATATGAFGTVRDAVGTLLAGQAGTAEPCADSVAHGH